MSLEGALEEERQLIAEILKRQKAGNSGTMRGRGRDTSPGAQRAHSRGLSSVRRSLSRSSSKDPDAKYAITAHDPSERLRSPSGSRVNDSEDELKGPENTSSSDEEQISDTDSEFEVDDGGKVLPNYASYSPDEVLDEKNSFGRRLRPKDELSQINNRKLVKDAIQAEKIDELLAAERALANAQSIGRHVPHEFLEKIEEDAKKVGTHIHYDPEKFYQDNTGRKEKLQEYAIYKKKLVSPEFFSATDGFSVPYTSDVEEKADSELARTLNEHVVVSETESNLSNQMAIRTITRGQFFELSRKDGRETPQMFVLCMDFSEESKYALEWCIGTVLVDGSVLYILNVIEDDDYSSMNLNGIQPNGANQSETKEEKLSKAAREKLRIQNVEEITRQTLDLLKLTKLQVHIVIESCHHPIPRHFMVEIIKHISPTLVIVGSRGTSAIKGVLLGSLSNHLVRKSTVPVMVVKNKLKKLTKKGKHFSNNISTLHSLAEAKVD
ncbi:hypothetical protein KL930_001014 [Ogataea haglerorum]|uniref:UspA domain-containing protein n=1 Tax=Ogataea haglerorum TaxID=1937702 RepID=A0AAN6DAJ1_9ASCO|nr:hypothetical protein KL915_001015 [Ogataea haglerorum]KAG7701986.1 hypothetical protein KL951_000442 [Ogataea haglerorum]KAG7711798.1 hypothetical protein KL914_000440 [Ogataea haglerorum]KAG7712570.1 hypothetical protein KL950_000441 [Ogataea haglerorum]KAG7722622.1 hypothetical protein KL913_000442 [Ogataea haglerorum]